MYIFDLFTYPSFIYLFISIPRVPRSNDRSVSGNQPLSLSMFLMLLFHEINLFQYQPNDSAREVNTTLGTIVGKLETLPNGKTVYEYLGIPYAKPPLNESRFARPESFQPWSGKKEAKEFGSACPQPHFDTPNFKREIGEGERRTTVLYYRMCVQPAFESSHGRSLTLIFNRLIANSTG